MRITLAIGLAVMALLTVLIGLAGPAVAADQCAAPGGGSCFSTIQAAIDAATDGDTVRVVVGTYPENIVITKDLTLLGGYDDTGLINRTPRSSVIDGGGLNSVVRVTGGAVVTIDGFTISGGDATTNDGSGGGIFVDTATVTIVDNLIEDNVASSDSAMGGDGGGIYATRSTVVISGNTIQSNKAYSVTTGSAWGGAGGGIEIGSANDEATIINNQILSNTAAFLTDSSTSAMGFGGGISCSGNKLVADGNTIKNNLALTAGGFAVGGGINVNRTMVVTITNNVIAENTTTITGTGVGGGLSAGGDDDGVGRRIVVTGNRIMSNTTVVNGDGAYLDVNGGVSFFGGDNTSGDSVLLENNDIVGNVALKNAALSGATVDGYVSAAGVVVYKIANTQIISNNISHNTAVAGSAGDWIGETVGGVTLDVSGITLVKNNNISGNTSDVAGLTIWSSVVTSTNNIFANNSRGGLRTGGSGSSSSTVRVINDTYYNNNEFGVETIGNRTTAFVTNTIISGHQNGFLRGLSDGAFLYSDYNLLNNVDNYEDATPGNHDILNQDPKFVNAANNDFHLAAGSPAINMGTLVGAPSVDFEGDPRPQDGRIDIGADESLYTTSWPTYLPVVTK